MSDPEELIEVTETSSGLSVLRCLLHKSGAKIESGKENDLEWGWYVASGSGDNTTTPEEDVASFVKFNWDRAELNGIVGYEGTLTFEVSRFYQRAAKKLLFSKTINVKLIRSGQVAGVKSIGKKTRFEDAPNTTPLYMAFSLVPIRESHVKIDKYFSPSPENDVILTVDGKNKLHVNKAVLSFHSEFFRLLFNSNFKEKSMNEVPISDVIYEDLATCLSFCTPSPISPTAVNVESILQLADRFLMFVTTRGCEDYLLRTDRIQPICKMVLAEKYGLHELLPATMLMLKNKEDVKVLSRQSEFEGLNGETKAHILHRLLEFI